MQGRFALASGGWWGLGLGASREKWSYLPNAHTDFILGIIGEELGLLGTVLVVALFAALAYTGIRIAARTLDPFSRLAASAITVWLVLQGVINMAAVVGLVPITGIPLPLISFGGSSLVPTLIAVGVLASVARAEPGAARALERAPRAPARAAADRGRRTPCRPARRGRRGGRPSGAAPVAPAGDLGSHPHSAPGPPAGGRRGTGAGTRGRPRSPDRARADYRARRGFQARAVAPVGSRARGGRPGSCGHDWGQNCGQNWGQNRAGPPAARGPGADPGDERPMSARTGSVRLRSVVLAAGGSAGHVEPALAVADALRAAHPDVVSTVLGHRGRPGGATGSRARLPRFRPFRGCRCHAACHGISSPSRGGWSAPSARRQRRCASARADVVVGFGGYVSAPAYLAARLHAVPIVVHEANSLPGLANRMGARLTRHVAVSTPETPLPHAVLTGIPLRRALLTSRDSRQDPAARAAARRSFGLDPDRPTLLAFGGSLGAAHLNTAMVAAGPRLTAAGIQVLHSTGTRKYADVVAGLRRAGITTGTGRQQHSRRQYARQPYGAGGTAAGSRPQAPAPPRRPTWRCRTCRTCRRPMSPPTSRSAGRVPSPARSWAW